MTDDDTARVRAYEADKERINDLRQGGDTQADVIRRLLSDREQSDNSPGTNDNVTKQIQQLRSHIEMFMQEPVAEVKGVNDDVKKQLDRIEDAATTAEERTGSIERTLEEFNR